jgi:hypothetical protein
LQGNPEFAEHLRKWKDDEDNRYKEAAHGLKYGFHGLTHPALNPPSVAQVQISQSNQSQFVSAPVSSGSSGASLAAKGRASIAAATAATGKAKDSIKVGINWSGDIAGKVKGVGSQINRGFSRVGSFFAGGN